MKERIKLHKEARPKHWKTFEEPLDLAKLLRKMGKGFDCILIDCLTLLVSNLILSGESQEGALNKIKEMLIVSKKVKARIILVSNEVGLGIVPDNQLGRTFRDIAGKVNQIIAKEAKEVYFTVSGIPMKIKGER
jgi:adenosylcobinamide kinase/adenosylcobinamide-phosphate guanylyltransferase